MFPAPRIDPCEELNAWRFQHCAYCGWSGDIATKTRYRVFFNDMLGYWIDKTWYGTLHEFLTTIGLC
jgi:hypothetical protein